MATIRHQQYDSGPVNAGEQRLFNFLETKLPDDYIIIPNANITISGSNHVSKPWEFDCIVIAPHAIFHIENKDWGAPITAYDSAWMRGGQEVPNPLISADYKTKLLATKIKNAHADWNIGFIHTIVTLSNPSQTKFGFDPRSECYKRTFTLGIELTEFLTDKSLTHNIDKIKSIQQLLTDFILGVSSKKILEERTQILEYKIEEKLEETDSYTEYMCVHNVMKGSRYKIREYPLLFADKSPMELEKIRMRVQNASYAQEKLPTQPNIIKNKCYLNESGTYFYEISQYQDESTLFAQLHQKTITQTDKINIVLDVASALKTAHDHAVFHRDIRPSNIYVFEGGKAAITNFRLAYFVEHSDMNYSVFQTAALSPYSAPELAQGDADASCDMFSLGVVFYELMTQQLPYADSQEFSFKCGGRVPESLMPSKVSNGLPEWMDEVVRHTILLDSTKRWSAQEFIDFVSQNITTDTAVPTPKNEPLSDTQKPFYLKDLKPGMKVSPSLVLNEKLGQGGFGHVYKAWHELQQRFYAIKIFERDASVENAKTEFDALTKLDHPNIVKFEWNDRTTPGNLFYTLMEYLDGENLYGYTKGGGKKLPSKDVYQMAHQILDALCYMQGKVPPIFHRDIKPGNIVWEKRNNFKLIDFNIAASTTDKAFAGTEPYMAPDLVESGMKINWDTSADTFALGITIYELLAQTYPWVGSKNRPDVNNSPIDISHLNQEISPEAAAFVMKAIKTDRNQRFATAKEMIAALESIGEDGFVRHGEKTVTTHEGTNIVDYINSLYSQSRHGNGGTRAGVKSSKLDQDTYTETKLDTVLINDIKALKYRLVIITGNAGDGKTAFIRRIEEVADNKNGIIKNPASNGSEFRLSGMRFLTNYDGSQDEGNKLNSDVLDEFFKPFFNLCDYSVANEGRVIAINEGRLTDYLSSRDALKPLRDNIDDYFYKEGHTELLPGLMVINLNLRSVTAKDGGNDSLLARQVRKLTAPQLWAQCEGCAFKDKCFIKYNVDTFQDTSAGGEVINRLEWLVKTAAYKKELHITMRDLRSMIAWLLTRDCDCNEVKQLIAIKDKYPEFYWQFYYFNLTADSIAIKDEYGLPTLYSGDRLIKMLRETDVALAALPAFDRDLYYKLKRNANYIVFAQRGYSILSEFNTVNEILPPYEYNDVNKKMRLKIRHKSFVRHQYFEGAIDFRRRLPYRFASLFEKQLKGTISLEETKKSLVYAISASEGCFNKELTNGYLVLASSNTGDPISKSYRRFPVDEFELFVNESGNLAQYIEYESDSFTFRHKTDTFISLTVSLDLFEMLQYISAGYSPSTDDLRGKFIELQIFKNLLEARTYSEILVTKNNQIFSAVRLDKDKNIVIEPLN